VTVGGCRRPRRELRQCGTLTADLNGGGDSGQDVAIQPNGKLVIARYAARGFTTDVALVRIDP
jgi:hypothetical protein